MFRSALFCRQSPATQYRAVPGFSLSFSSAACAVTHGCRRRERLKLNVFVSLSSCTPVVVGGGGKLDRLILEHEVAAAASSCSGSCCSLIIRQKLTCQPKIKSIPSPLIVIVVTDENCCLSFALFCMQATYRPFSPFNPFCHMLPHSMLGLINSL